MSARAGSDPGDQPRRPWWSSAAGDPRERERRAGAGGDREFGSAGPSAGGVAGGPQATSHDHEHCRACPICSFLEALDDSRPEVVEHLTEAARHLTLAAKTFIDAQAAGFDGQDDVLERIRLDDD